MADYRKIWVTGASGFLGGRIVEGLRDYPARCIAGGRDASRLQSLAGFGAELAPGDLLDQDYVFRTAEGCDLIVHCAALSSPWGTYQAFYEANILATRHLIEAAKTFQVKRFILISTPSIYFNFKDRFDIRESDPLPRKMVNHYASTKWQSELEVLNSGLPALALRPRAIIGSGDTVIMPRILYAYRQNRLRVIGKGDNVVNVTPVANVVHAVRCCMDAPETALGRAYNITSGEAVRLWDLLEGMFDRLNLPFQRRHLPFPVAMSAAWLMEQYARRISRREPALTRYSVGILAQNMTMNIDLAQQHLGYTPVQTAWDGMEEFAQWWQAQSDSARHD